MAAILAAAGGEGGVVQLGGGQQPRGRFTQRRRAGFADCTAHEHPAAFLAPFGQPGVAQDADMARHARLTLPQHLREFAHRQLHMGQQAHDAQPRRVGQRAHEGIDPHLKSI